MLNLHNEEEREERMVQKTLMSLLHHLITSILTARCESDNIKEVQY